MGDTRHMSGLLQLVTTTRVCRELSELGLPRLAVTRSRGWSSVWAVHPPKYHGGGTSISDCAERPCCWRCPLPAGSGRRCRARTRCGHTSCVVAPLRAATLGSPATPSSRGVWTPLACAPQASVACGVGWRHSGSS